MSKIGVGVGEEFPVQDPPPPLPPPSDDERRRMERHWRWRRWLHVATRVAFLVLVLAAIVWMFTGSHYAVPGTAAGAVRPYAHHFLFPFFPIFLLLLFAFAWRRGCGWRRGWHRHHYHHHHYGEPREEA